MGLGGLSNLLRIWKDRMVLQGLVLMWGSDQFICLLSVRVVEVFFFFFSLIRCYHRRNHILGFGLIASRGLQDLFPKGEDGRQLLARGRRRGSGHRARSRRSPLRWFAFVSWAGHLVVALLIRCGETFREGDGCLRNTR